MSSSSQKSYGWRRKTGIAAGVVSIIVVLVIGAFKLFPLPGVLLIRAAFRKNDLDVMRALQKHVPCDVTSYTNLPYRHNDPDALLDVHVPNAAVDRGNRLPTVVWTHGGAWVAGSKDEWAPYFMNLASRAYTVVGINYTRGPDATYPNALHQLNDALIYLQANADRLHIDTKNIVLAGDSAGSQISTQIATAVTNKDYAAAIGISPAISPKQLKGMVLYCGIYDMNNYFGAGGLIGWGSWVSTWAYTGRRGTTFVDNPALAEMSTINHVTYDFPPSFISGGNEDPLTNIQSRPLATRLQELGVDVTTLFFPDDHEPGLSHEYQFNLDNADGRHALDASVVFLESVFQQP